MKPNKKTHQGIFTGNFYFIIANAALIILIFSILLAKTCQAQTKSEINGYCHLVSIYYKMPVEILPAIISVESSYNKNAVSDKGAHGLMQIMPCAYQDYSNRNPKNTKRWISNYTVVKTDWKANISVGAWYLRKVCYGASKSWKEAITAYFYGPWNTNITMNYYEKVKDEF